MKKRSLLRILIPVLFLVAELNNSYAQSNTAQTLWLAKPVMVDGIADEWASSTISYNKETRLSYAIANDGTNLYILIKSADQHTNSRILANSITININPKGKRKAVSSVSFPLFDRDNTTRNQQFAGNRRAGSPVALRTDSTQNKLLATENTITLDGFSKAPGGTIALTYANTYGIKAAAAFDKNKIYVYELAIPLSELKLSPYQKKMVAYNIKINGFSDLNNDPYGIAANGRGNYPGNGGMPRVGGGIIGIGGNGMPRIGGTIQIGGGRKTSQGRQTANTTRTLDDTKDVDFWVKSKLARGRR